MKIICATWFQSRWAECIESWNYPVFIIPKLELMEAYQVGFVTSDEHDSVLGFIHDDVLIHEPRWWDRVAKEFTDPTVGLVGFGGAIGHGHPKMYELPYHLPHLGRSGFVSNMRQAELHGRRLESSCEVSVLDGFALFVRRKVLEKAGGWPLGTPVGYIAYDYWLSCMTRRLGYKIRMVGVDCDHLGGKSTGLNPNLDAKFDEAHRYIYDQFKDVLPYRVEAT